jgi:Fe2+ or Zn2+ uptake regulation protein
MVINVERLTSRLRERGQRVTSQRLLIYQYLQGNTEHPTAEDIYTAIRATLPTISLGTVYKILNELVELGEVRQVDLGDGRTRFDPTTSQHIHLRCVSCGTLLDLPEEAAPVSLPAAPAGFQLLRYNLTLEGHCPACQARAELTA